jgi:excisionase family DNA binding protein
MMKPFAREEFVTIDEAASKYGVTRSTVYNAVRAGRVEGVVRKGNMILLPIESVDAWRRAIASHVTAECREIMKVLNLQIEKSLADEMSRHAHDRRMSMTAYCRMAIRRQIEEDKKNEF